MRTIDLSLFDKIIINEEIMAKVYYNEAIDN